jgi:hypothetical protein
LADGTGLIVEVPIDEGLVSLGQAIPPQLAAEIGSFTSGGKYGAPSADRRRYIAGQC